MVNLYMRLGLPPMAFWTFSSPWQLGLKRNLSRETKNQIRWSEISNNSFGPLKKSSTVYHFIQTKACVKQFQEGSFKQSKDWKNRQFCASSGVDFAFLLPKQFLKWTSFPEWYCDFEKWTGMDPPIGRLGSCLEPRACRSPAAPLLHCKFWEQN